MNPEADFDNCIKTLRNSKENDGLEEERAGRWSRGGGEERRQRLKSLDGVLSQTRMQAVFSVGQAYAGAQRVLSIVFANLEYKLKVGFFCTGLVYYF